MAGRSRCGGPRGSRQRRHDALNQGIYNLFLALGMVVGIVLTWVDEFRTAGLGVMLFACLSYLLIG